jgi:hypothetical protein
VGCPTLKKTKPMGLSQTHMAPMGVTNPWVFSPHRRPTLDCSSCFQCFRKTSHLQKTYAATLQQLVVISSSHYHLCFWLPSLVHFVISSKPSALSYAEFSCTLILAQGENTLSKVLGATTAAITRRSVVRVATVCTLPSLSACAIVCSAQKARYSNC